MHLRPLAARRGRPGRRGDVAADDQETQTKGRCWSPGSAGGVPDSSVSTEEGGLRPMGGHCWWPVPLGRFLLICDVWALGIMPPGGNC